MDRSSRNAGLHAVALLCACIVCLTSVAAQGRQTAAANCALTPDQILGQAFSGTAGAAGEISENGVTPEGESIEDEGLGADPVWLMQTLPYAAAGEEQVAVLVIDDFSSDGSGETPMSHGWLVWQVFEQLLAQLPPDVAGLITLEQVNIADEAGYRSDLILPALRSAVDARRGAGISRFVLNMSFVFVPCSSPDLRFNFAEYRAARQRDSVGSLVEFVGGDVQYVRSILADSRVSYIDTTGLAGVEQESPRGSAELPAAEGQADIEEIPPTPARGAPAFRGRDLSVLQLFDNRNLQSDPLREYLRSVRDVIVVPVASAGNFKQRQPFYPARWPEVLSVSANEGNDLRFWLHSNNGDLSVPGAWFLFDDGQYRAGTSFAAPVVSMLIALDLTQTEPMCGVRGNAPILARGAYDNELLGLAVQQFCE